ncbi:MAG: small subunit ribosomal protein [Candidatus Woesearchaeota archaeon]|nr:small subunit ribosomal protein [Candidatus Woesearchaeota archaeon]MDN5327729.1 small subunit ribosomal protein [Candidatus Woesearchaeota archaeon]
MGDPKRIRKKYETPSHPWQKSRIVEEKELIKRFGLKNHRELWRVKTFVSKQRKEAMRLIPLKTEQAEKEKKQLMDKLIRLGLLSKDSAVTDVLNLSAEDALNRRLQTLVFKKGLARTIKQARQMIVHGHIVVNGVKITSPSYLVSVEEEAGIEFDTKSPFYDVEHPERVVKGGVVNE